MKPTLEHLHSILGVSRSTDFHWLTCLCPSFGLWSARVCIKSASPPDQWPNDIDCSLHSAVLKGHLQTSLLYFRLVILYPVSLGQASHQSSWLQSLLDSWRLLWL